MKKLKICCFFVFIIYYVKCDNNGQSTKEGGYNFPEKSRILNKTRTYISSWLSLDQMNTIAAALENMASPTLLETKTIDELKTDVINVGLNTLTTQQKVFVTTFGAKFLGKYGNYEDSFNVAMGIMMNNCLPFSNQLIEMYQDYEDRGKTQAQIWQRGFKMVDMFMTKKRIGTIYCRLKAGFMKYDATIWPYMRQNINTIISFSVLEALPNACTPTT